MRKGLPVVWDLVKPLLLYYAGYYITYFLVQTLLSQGGMAGILQEEKAVFGGICMSGGCLFLFPMIRQEQELQQKEKKEKTEEEKAPEKKKYRAARYVLLMVYAAASCVFLNMAVGFTGLAGKSEAFQRAAESQYAVSPGMGLLLYAGVSALTEELVFRFLLYNRLRRFCNRAVYGMAVSAFLFGAYHGNIVQGCYAFALGILIALSYLYFDSFLAPVLFHSAGNAVIFLCNIEPEAYAVLFTAAGFVLCGLISAAGTVFMIRKVQKVL